MKWFYLSLFFLSSLMIVNAQSSQTYRPIYDNLVPVSPSAFQFLKYVEMPVSEYTGLPSIAVPFYTIKEDGLEIPISLSYHAGGNRVSQDASWVGLGWDMTFGSIVQIINDQDDLGYLMGYLNPRVIPDYFHNAIPGEFAHRWNYYQDCQGQFQGQMWTPTLSVNTPQANFGFMIATDYYVPVNGDFSTRRVELFDYPEYDSEPDIFKANFFGHSINYIIANNGQPVVLNKQGYRIEKMGTGENYTWRITVPSGEVYFFEERNIVETYSSTVDFWGVTSSGPYKASSKIWMLTKILTKNKRPILFNYSRTASQVQYPNFVQKKYKMNSTSSSIIQPTIGGISIAKTDNGLNCVDCYGQTMILNREDILTPSSIVFPKGRIDFTCSARQDLNGGSKLDNVQIKAETVIQTAQLNYTYFDATDINSPGFSVTDDNFNRLRLKLNSIIFRDGAAYQFIYNNTPLPKKNSFAQDYWGFYNGNLTNSSMVPNPAQFNQPNLFNNGDNHSSRLEFAKAAILEKIVYPTGGSTTFGYSLNEFSNYWVPDYSSSSNTISKGNGLRVNSVIFSAANNNVVSKKTVYTYENGLAILPKEIIRTFNYNTADYSPCGTIIGSLGLTYNNYSITEVNGNGFFSSSSFGSLNSVGYTKVTKTEVDEANQTLGRVETYFHNNADRTANTSNSTTHLSVSLPAIEQYDKVDNGLVKEIKFFNKEGALIKLVSNNYTFTLSDIFYGARIYGYGVYLHQSRQGVGACQNSCGWYYKAQHLIGYYPIFDKDSRLVETITSDYSHGQTKTTSKGVTYDQFNQIRSEYLILPDFTNEIVSYTRTYDAAGAVRDNMMGANRLSDIWEIETKVYPPNTYPAIKKSKTSITYKMLGDKFVEEQANIFDRIEQNGVPKKITYDVYDSNNGNLREYTTNNLKTSLIWDYNNQYAIAEVKNAGVADVAYTSFEADGNGGWGFGPNNITTLQGGITGVKSYNLLGGLWKNDLQTTKTYRVSFWVYGDKPGTNTIDINGNPSAPLAANVFQLKTTRNGWKLYEGIISNATGIGIWPGSSSSCYIDELRLFPDKALMTTFTHIPLVGISSQNDVNNRISYYEYDNANRLIIVRDQDKNIVRKICYNFAGQPEECSTFYNSTKTGIYVKNDCGANGQGTSVTYTVPENRYSASTQLQADALAQNDINTNGQAYANQFGGCVFSSYDYSNYYYSEVCTQLGQTPEPIYVSVPAGMFTSTTSLQDANNQAYQYAQNYANQYGTCISGVDLYLYNGTGYNYITIMMTNTSTYEQYYFYVSPYNYGSFGNVPQGTYDIYMSMDYGYGWYSFQAGCFNYTYGNSAYFYSVPINNNCNQFSIN